MADLTYEVSFKGVASPTLRAAFSAYELTSGSGLTLIRCPQAALGQVIAQLEELGLDLLDVRLIADRSHPAQGGDPLGRTGGHCG